MTLLFDEDYATAPHDPEMAFVHLSQLAKERMFAQIDNELSGTGKVYEAPFWMELAATVDGIIHALGLDLGIDLKVPINDDHFDDWLVQFKSKLTSVSTGIRLRAARTGASNDNPALTFEAVHLGDKKDEVRGYTQKIRKIIRAIDIDQHLREALFNRLNAFERELDRDRTRWESAISVGRTLARAVGEGAKELEPAVKLFERIMGVMDKASMTNAVGQAKKKMLPAPKEDFSPDYLDDDIPF